MLTQTKKAVEALKKSGFTRKEFSCKTPRDSNGEYGMPQILIWAPKEKQLRLVEEMVSNGLNVTRFRNKETRHEGYPNISLSHNEKGSIFEVSL